MAAWAPLARSSHKMDARAVVSGIESKMPRLVFDFPNKGRPSKKAAPASSGKEKRGPNTFFATIGVPFANVISTSNCEI